MELPEAFVLGAKLEFMTWKGSPQQEPGVLEFEMWKIMRLKARKIP